MSKLVWLPEALGDLMRHFEFLKDNNPDAACRAAQAIRDTGFSLVQFPQRGKTIEDGTNRRKLIVRFGKSSYVMHYLYDFSSDTVIIIRIYHGREERRL